MSDWSTIWAALVPPIGGWAIYVEKRLAKIDAIKDKLDSVDDKVERLVDHLIEEKK